MSGVVAITGATGFAGSHVVPLLLASGLKLRALVRDPRNAPAGVEFVAGDLSNTHALADLCTGASTVVHLAGAISAPDRTRFFEVNKAGTRALAEAAAKAGVRRFIHVSSLAAREPELSGYAASKRAGEEAVFDLQRFFALAVLRPPAIYGPGDRATLPLLQQLTRRIAFVPGHSDGRFSLIYAADLARFILSLLPSQWTGLAEIDDGKNNGYGWHDLATIAAQVEGHNVTPVFVPRFLLAGIARVAPSSGLTLEKVSELYHRDWVCRGEQPPLSGRTGFAVGYRETLLWYRKHGWLPAGNVAPAAQ